MRMDKAPAERGQAMGFYIPAILALVGAALTGLDAIFMAEGAAAMAPGGHTGTLLAGVAICAAIFKAGWLASFHAFLAHRQILLALAALGFGLLTHVFSIASTVGIAATGREAVVAARMEAREKHKRALAAYEDARERSASMPGTRPIAQIRAELADVETEVAEQGRRETAERATACGSRCVEAIRQGETAKARRAALQGELAIAMEAAKVDGDLIDATAALKDITVPGTADPQSATLAAYVPLASFTEREAALLLPLLPSLVVEIGAPVCFLIAGAFWSLAREQRGLREAASAPIDIVRLEPATGKATQGSATPAFSRLPAPTVERAARFTPAMSAQELATIRAAIGENQEAFAERFGVTARTIRRWEAGAQKIGRSTVVKARTIAADMCR